MPLPRLLVPLTLATGFGVVNAVLVHLHTNPVAEFGSHVLGAGWAWAGLAVFAGALARTRLLGAAAGGLAAGLGLAAYYVTDATLRDVTLATSARGDLVWGLASVLVCPVLGFLGTRIGRPGLLGVLAALLVPAGALAEMLLFPPGPPSPAVTWTRWTVAVLALAALTLTLLRRGSTPPHPTPLAVIKEARRADFLDHGGVRIRGWSGPGANGRSPHPPPRPRRR